MKKFLLHTWTLTAATALITGIICQSFFPFVFLVLCALASLVMLLVFQISSMIMNAAAAIRIMRVIAVFFLIAAITSFISLRISEYTATKRANHIIEALYIYKQQHGHYPQKLQAVENLAAHNHINNLSYTPDSSGQQFELTGWSDGWHWKTYRSAEQAWRLEE